MEVEANVLSSFDLNSGNIPAFSFSSLSVSSEKKTLELRKLTDDQMSENGGERGAGDAPAAAITRCTSAIAAMKLQKVYRGYRTRRMLADSAVVAEGLWWQALDFARLNHSTVSFFDVSKPETTASRWNRVKLNASKVGNGLSKDAKAQKLAFQHWIEAIDPRHRYGHSLHIYYEEWCKASAGQPFFYWLDVGDGKEVDLKECPRSKLRQQCIKYLGPKERQHYEYHVVDGKIMHTLTGEPLDTNKESTGSKWIFVLSTSKRLYSGEKKKGLFHHSSFLAGGATLAAGRLIADDGVLKCISAYSGHYKPTDDCFDTFLSFLNENGVNLDEVEIRKAKDDYDNNGENGEFTMEVTSGVMSNSDSIPCNLEDQLLPTDHRGGEETKKTEYKRTLFGGLQSPKADIPRTSILQRIETKKVAKSYESGHPLSYRWSTGAGTRIGHIADYPVELRLQALELMNLSLQTDRPPLFTPRGINADGLVSMSSSPTNVGNNDLEALNRP